MHSGGILFNGEFHLPGYNFCGPGTQLEKRLDENDNPYEWSKPINKIDEISMMHDLTYRDYSSAKGRQVADQIMLDALDNLNDDELTTREKLDRRIVRPLIVARKFVGFGLPVTEQEAKEMHGKIVRNFPRRKVIVHHIDDIWSADLVEMPNDLGYHYILTVIDCFSKYAWAIPLKNKQSNTVIDAFKTCLDNRSPKFLWTDSESEFINKQFKKFLLGNNIKLYHTYNEGKAVIIERFNRTIKEKMWYRFTVNGNKHWVKILPDIIAVYNNTIHRTIQMTPTFASRKENEICVIQNLNTTPIELAKKPKYKVGDLVRIYKYKKHFEKGYETNFTTEVFKVTEVILSNPVTYKLSDLKGEEIIGRFYTNELVLSVRINGDGDAK